MSETAARPPSPIADNHSALPSPTSSTFSDGSEIKNPPEMQEIQVPFLGQEDPLEKDMATHSNILAWRIPWTQELGGL